MKPLVPVYNPASAPHFADPSVIAPWTIAGQPEGGLRTSALKPGVPLDLIGISQASDPDGVTTLDPNIYLARIYYRVKGDDTVFCHSFIRENGQVEPLTSFVAAVADDFRDMKLNIGLRHYVTSDGEDVTVEMKITGTINLETATVVVNLESADGVVGVGYVLQTQALTSLSHADTSYGEEMVDEDEEPDFIPSRAVTLHDIPGQVTPIQINATDEQGSGGAYHQYEVSGMDLKKDGISTELPPQIIRFQNGPVPDHGNNGVTMEHLLAVAGHRLQCFQAGPFASGDNAEALHHIKYAINALNRRTLARIARGVEGKEVA